MHNRVIEKVLSTTLMQPTFSEGLSKSDNSVLNHDHHPEATVPYHPDFRRPQWQNFYIFLIK